MLPSPDNWSRTIWDLYLLRSFEIFLVFFFTLTFEHPWILQWLVWLGSFEYLRRIYNI